MDNQNILGTQPIGKLLRKFAIPSIISMLVVSLYNIVDQFFIGQTVGELGNAATNVAFPISTLCVAVTLAFGIGGASGFNLNMGAGKKEKAMKYIGNALTMLFGIGVIISLVVELFMKPLLVFFGSPDNVLPYAIEYVRIIMIGTPFVIFSNGGTHLVRADGSPTYSMWCNLSGALINVVLDYLFVMVFKWGMSGAAAATVIGQVVGFVMVICYVTRFKSGKIAKKDLIPRWSIIKNTVSLGMAPCINQLAMMVVQIILNKSLTYYGALSEYGSSVALACSGIIMKVNMLYFSFCIGIAQAMQPIASYNRGAGKNDRVKKVYITAVCCNEIISVVAFIIFQLFPRQIIGIFGNGSAEYFAYAERFIRIFLFMTFLNGIQPLSSSFCTAIGKPGKGTFLSLTRQIIFWLPTLIFVPIIFTYLGLPGIHGIMYSAPIADVAAAIVSIIMIRSVFKKVLVDGGENATARY